MAHHPMRGFRVPAAPETSTRRILVCLRVFGLLLTFSFSGWILTGCSGLKGSQSINSAAPSITLQPANQSVTAGQTATFTVAATGTAPLSYQWRKNGTAVAGATSSTYAMPSTTSSDNGSQFSVVVSNTAGSVTSAAATLTVSAAPVAPSITKQPASKSVTAGQPATFTVTATGTAAPLGYQWRKNGTAIAGAASSSYTTPPTTSSDNGSQFSVVVSNRAGSVTSTAATLTVSSSAQPPFGHVFIVVEENTNYAQVIGSASMPYLNGLINQYGLATQYYASTNPSIGNYFMLTTGQILTNNDGEVPQSFPVSADNVVRELVAVGKTWKAYAEDLPSVGYTGGNSGNYAVRHNPLAYMTDVQNSSVQKQNLVPFTQFPQDLASGNLPDYSFIVPNLCNDAHDCGLNVADTWLQANIGPLITSQQFQRDGLLIIVFDESDSDNTHGDGRVVALLFSPPSSRTAHQSTTLYQHQSVLRLMLEGLGIKTLPGAAATAPKMWEFFTFPPPS